VIQGGASGDHRTWILLALVAVISIAVHGGGIGNGFTLDDTWIVVDNPLVTGPGGLWPIVSSHYWASVDREGDLYRPLTIASYWLTNRLFGLEPWAYHLGNILLNAAVGVLVVLICLRLSGSQGVALAAGILFATHTVHTEAVASVVGRAELLSALFVLWAWLLRRRTFAMSVLFACGLLSKENAIVLPGLLLIEDLAARWRGRSEPLDPRPWAALLGVAVAFVGLRIALLGPHLGALDGPFVRVGVTDRLLTAVSVLGRYLGLGVAPIGLSADYSYNQIPIVTDPLAPGVLIGATATAALIAAAWFARRRAPGAAAGILVFLVALFPVSNVPFGIGVVMAERLLYLPSMGICLVAAVLIDRPARTLTAMRGRRLVAATALAACVPGAAMAALTWRRTQVWRDPLTLFEATVRSSPDSALAHFGLGSAYQAAGRHEEAENAYRRSLSIAPERAETHYNLATLLEQAGRPDEAIREYGEAVRLDPDHRKAHNNLGRLHQIEGRPEEAEAEYRLAIAADERQAGAWSNLGTVLQVQGRLEEAVEAMREAVRLDPDDSRTLNNLGRLLVALGKAAEAVPVLERAVERSGGAPTPTVNLAAALLASGDLARARRLVTAVLDADPADPAARRVFDAIEARSGGAP